ncbi:tripartite tricarboxylate transporter TctB family protein [Halomonas sp. KO116]|uniref:tripartite tricarboxylate transporter TctB family protein n=1 Tax=Halomonas sp. KO116 TaxID=1504981 RepID=UPI0004E3D63E|nr:tripartite tricarboxylate transporter TctB family protein [Halomonas sp. KO116]AJY52333.1 hypothetical protein KO116_03866 [Halomonas sp. KO116]
MALLLPYCDASRGFEMNSHRLLGGFSVLVGAVLLLVIIPAQTVPVSYGALAPSDFPSFAAGSILICGLVQLFFPTGTVHFSLGEATRALLVTLGALVAALGLERVGFLLVAPPCVLAVMLFMGERRVSWLLIGGIVAPLLIWMLFEILLGRPLP